MTYEEALKAGHDYKGAKSIVEGYCVHCLKKLSNLEGAWTNFGNECESCLRKY